MQTALVTGSCGLVGRETCLSLLDKGWNVVGVDCDMRKVFFGEAASTAHVKEELEKHWGYKHFNLDIRRPDWLRTRIFREIQFDFIVHTAAQPSHDWAREHPGDDFHINVTGTHNMLELAREFCPQAPFIFTSSSKVYNTYQLAFDETTKRYDARGYLHGVPETFPIDHIGKSLFGAHKAAADLIAQEYALYFDMKVGVFRGGCLTGPAHGAVEMHGFLNYLIKCIKYEQLYTIFGYKGKQVRDNIHSEDLVNAFYDFYKDPKPGVYNIGGGTHSNCSILEAIEITETISGKTASISYVDQPRTYDHQWYVSDVRKFQAAYPNWKYNWSIEETIEDIYREV